MGARRLAALPVAPAVGDRLSIGDNGALQSAKRWPGQPCLALVDQIFSAIESGSPSSGTSAHATT